jgi:hypothetical protein
MERLAVNRNVPAAFVPVVAAASSEDVSHSPAASTSSVIEIELAGMIVRVRGRVPAEALAEVLTAVKRVA